eukprot:20668-Heterococcus_DN1.PRE.4
MLHSEHSTSVNCSDVQCAGALHSNNEAQQFQQCTKALAVTALDTAIAVAVEQQKQQKQQQL